MRFKLNINVQHHLQYEAVLSISPSWGIVTHISKETETLQLFISLWNQEHNRKNCKCGVQQEKVLKIERLSCKRECWQVWSSPPDVRKYVYVFSVLHHSKLNVWRFWTVQTKQHIEDVLLWENALDCFHDIKYTKQVTDELHWTTTCLF